MRFPVARSLFGILLGLSFLISSRLSNAATTGAPILAEVIGTPADGGKVSSRAETLEEISSKSFKVLSEGSEGHNNVVLEEDLLTPKTDGSVEEVWASSTADLVYVVQIGDSLGSIAQDRYGNLKHYRMIYEENRDQIADPNRIYPGQKLVLPEAP